MSKALDLGERTYRVYRELIRFIDQHGYVPSQAELGQAVGCSPSTISRHLVKLEEEGLVRRVGRKARSVVVRVAE